MICATGFFTPASTAWIRREASPRPASPTRVHGATTPAPEPAEEPEAEFAKLARLVRSNDRLLADLRALRPRLAAARAYLAEPGCHVRLGASYLGRLRDRQSQILASLRSNRLEARALLASLGS